MKPVLGSVMVLGLAMTPSLQDPPDSGRSDGCGEAIFEVQDLGVGIGGHLLLEGFDLRVQSGQAVAVTGTSGCGKSTLLRTLAGLIDPTAGAIRLRGRPPEALGFPEWRRRVQYVAQRPVLLLGTVLDNLLKPFSFRAARGRPFPMADAQRGIEQLALPQDCLDRDARTLSEGQQQRVGLLRALLVEPEILLLDEPTSALDPDSLERCESFIEAQLSRSGAAALVVTHDPGQARRLGDSVVALDDYRHGPSAGSSSPGRARSSRA